MTSTPSFSVIIPTYNRASLVLETLQTVFRQERPADEIIVVDNCSTDETASVVEEVMQRHSEVRFYQHPENLERAASRNTGMEHATSDYVTFLDSDDFMYRKNLADAEELVTRTGAKWFHNLYESVDDSGSRLRSWPFPRLGNTRKALAAGNFLSCIGVFLHRDIYQTYRFDTNPLLTGSEDWDLWLRIAAEHDVDRIPNVNSGIRQHEGRTVARQDLEQAEARVAYILNKLRSDAQMVSAFAPFLSLLTSVRQTMLASIANDNGEHRRARAYLRDALRSYPPVAFRRFFIRTAQLALFGRWRPAH